MIFRRITEADEGHQVGSLGVGKRKDEPDPAGIVSPSPECNPTQPETAGAGNVQELAIDAWKVVSGRSDDGTPGSQAWIEDPQGSRELASKRLGQKPNTWAGITRSTARDYPVPVKIRLCFHKSISGHRLNLIRVDRPETLERALSSSEPPTPRLVRVEPGFVGPRIFPPERGPWRHVTLGTAPGILEHAFLGTTRREAPWLRQHRPWAQPVWTIVAARPITPSPG